MMYEETGATILKASANQSTYDAFNRLRISAPFTRFDSKQLYNNQPIYWDDAETSGTGTGSSHSANTASSTMTVSASTAGTRVRQTFQRIHYQPGKSHLIFMTGVLGASATGITRSIGYYDDNNGLFFQQDGDTLYLVRRTFVTGSAVDNKVAQSDWNADKMDGTGLSKKTFDPSKAQIFVIDFEWLGTGSVRFGVVSDEGNIIILHQMRHANVLSTVYMSTPDLPLRYEISNDGTGGAASLEHICSQVSSEGGDDANGILGSISTAGTHLDANVANTLYALIGIRLKSTTLGIQIDILEANLLTETNDDFEWQVILNPTVAGTFTYVDVTNYSIQRALGATANTVTGGTLLASGWVSSGASNSFPLETARRLGSAIDGTVDEIALCVRPLGSNADIQGSINFRER